MRAKPASLRPNERITRAVMRRCPVGGPDVVRPDIQARPRATWRCGVRITHNVRCAHKPQPAATRYRAEAVGAPVLRRGLCRSETARGRLARKMPRTFS